MKFCIPVSDFITIYLSWFIISQQCWWNMAEETEQSVPTPGDELVMAHVLFLDIVGYSKLPMEQQRRVLQQLQALVRATQEFAQTENSGQLLCLPTGDGMALVFFTPTPLTPVQCALELGQALRASSEIALRMGVHSGPVYPHLDIRVNKNVVGGGINIAQRVMDCGDAGHILLSKAVADVLNQIGGWAGSLHDIGEIEVKHGLRVHVFSLCSGKAGNSALPRKYTESRKARTRKRATFVLIVCTILAVLGSASFWLWHRSADRRPSPDKPAPTWAYRLTLEGHRDNVYSVTFSPDSQTVVGGSYDHTIILWDAQTGGIQRALPMSDKFLVYMVALSPAGGNVVAAGVGRDVLLEDVKAAVPLRSLKGHTGFVFAVAFAPDGRTLVSGGEDHTIKVWDVQTGQVLRTLSEHADEVNAIAFSADGKLLVSGSYDMTILIWDVATWSVKTRLAGHSGRVYSVAFAPDGRTLASSSEDGTVRLWDVQSGTLKQTLYHYQGVVNSVAFAPDGGTVASAGNDGVVVLWDTRNGAVRQKLRRHTAGVTAVAFAPDGRTLASGSKDRTVILWEVQTSDSAAGATRSDPP
jgi:WD40 repeat protein